MKMKINSANNKQFYDWLYFKLFKSWAKKYQKDINWEFFLKHMTTNQVQGYFSQFIQEQNKLKQNETTNT